MAKILEMPKLSPTMEEGRLATWHKNEGDAVGIDDLLAEVETDKATMEFRSFDKGTLLKILVPAGSNVVLGQPVAIMGDKGEDISALEQKASSGKVEAAKAPSVDNVQETKGESRARKQADNRQDQQRDAQAKPAEAPAQPETESATGTGTPSESIGSDGRVKSSPYVRKVAREQGIDLTSVRGSGPHGRVIARDLESAPKGGARPAARVPVAPGELAKPTSKPLSMMRKTIARRLTESKQTVPHFYLTVDLDADALVSLREKINADLAALAGKDEKPEKISLNDLLVKACAIGLRRVPECNASFTPEAILYHQRVDISVAVAVEDGLVTPVVRDADRKSVLEIGAEVKELAARARNKKLKPEEMMNGTFSISNLGMYGIDEFAAVINPPEGAILAIGQTRREPVVRGDQIVVGHKLAVTLSCDHRVVDGAVGATFLRELRSLVEHPTRILL